MDIVRFKIREGAQVVLKLGRILEIEPANVFRKRGINLTDAGKHCRISSEGNEYYKRVNRVQLVAKAKKGKANDSSERS